MVALSEPRRSKKNLHWSEQAETNTSAHNIQTLTHSQISSNELVLKKKPQVPINFHCAITRNQKASVLVLFEHVTAHSHIAFTDQNKIVQPLLSKPLLTYTLRLEKSFFYINFRQCLTIKGSLLSKSELNHRFGEAYKLEESTFRFTPKFPSEPKVISETSTNKDRRL